MDSAIIESHKRASQQQLDHMAANLASTNAEYAQWCDRLSQLTLKEDVAASQGQLQRERLSISDINQAYIQQMASLVAAQSEMTARVAELRRRYEDVLCTAGGVPVPEPMVFMA